MTDISVVDYRPDPTLDAELAELGYASVEGWPDQRPLTATLVRSVLRPTGLTATTLALHRDVAGRLRGAAAVRWPATLEASGWLWGPMVHPEASGGGLGKALLRTVAEIMATHPGVHVVSTEIPETRTAAWSMFERAGWHPAGTTRLLKRPLPGTVMPSAGGRAPAIAAPSPMHAAPSPMHAASPVRAAPSPVRAAPSPVRAARQGEYLDQAIAVLVSSARPEVCYATARDTFVRWAADARYVPAGLLLVDGPDGLLGAALVYPMRHRNDQEPAEALIADLLVARGLDPSTAAGIRAALVAAALDAGAATGAAVARAIVDEQEWTETLLAAGFEIIENYRYYAPNAPRPGATPLVASAYLGR